MTRTRDASCPPAQADWCVRLLGRLEVATSTGELVRFRSRTALYLLAYLLLNQDKEHSNAELEVLFWPESDGDRQAQNLRRAVADLRKVLEQDLPLGSVVVTRKGSVSLNRDRLTTDVERFHSLTSQAADEDEPARLSEAVRLYQGPLLAPLTDEWVVSHRMELEERFGQAVDRLCANLDKNGDVKQAICIGRAAIVVAPCREDVHIALIRAYNSAGMQVEALRQFEELERILDETWGEAPSAAARGALDAGIATRRSRHNLPEELTSFIGREKQIEEVCELLTQTRLLTLTGSGGCGKTRLSLQAAKKVLDKYRDGVWLVEFAALTDPALVPKTIAVALGLAEQPGKSLDQALLDFLSARHLLLVLDNCEHLLLACAQVVEAVLRQCPFVVVLANSREGLAIGGELVYRLPSLSLPNPKDPQTPESLSQFESVQLFVERARHVHSAFAVTGQTAAAVASVCNRLDGIPLAIELAAARLRTLSVEEVNQRLDERFRLLTGGSRTALPRQQTLRSLIDWSYDLLSETEKALFCRLAVFAGGWTLESAEGVCADGQVEQEEILDLLTSLSHKNLVVAQPQSGITRYRLLETVRQYARDRLMECGTVQEWRDRHLLHFLALAEEAEPHLEGSNQQVWLERLDSDHDNVRAAIEWATESNEDSEPDLRLTGAIFRFWYVRGHMREGRGLLTGLLTAERRSKPTAAVAKALNAAGSLAYGMRDYPAARAMYEESLEMSQQLSDQPGIVQSLNGLGNVAIDTGEFPIAQSLHEECLAFWRQLGDRNRIARSLHNLGNVAFEQGDQHDVAIMRFKESLAMLGVQGNGTVVASSFYQLGIVALEQSDFRASYGFLQESLSRFRLLGDYRFVAKSLEGLASLQLALGDPLGATKISGAVERLRGEIDEPVWPNDYPPFEPLVAAAREALGDDKAFDRAWQEGRALTLEQAVELALAHDMADA